jgi:hypothetical protein
MGECGWETDLPPDFDYAEGFHVYPGGATYEPLAALDGQNVTTVLLVNSNSGMMNGGNSTAFSLLNLIVPVIPE